MPRMTLIAIPALEPGLMVLGFGEGVGVGVDVGKGAVLLRCCGRGYCRWCARRLKDLGVSVIY
jgi:hypothetical protein